MNPLACPKCNYERKATDTAPLSTCPSCGVIFSRIADSQTRRGRVPRKEAAEPSQLGGLIVKGLAVIALCAIVFIVAFYFSAWNLWLLLAVPLFLGSLRSEASKLRSKFQSLGELPGLTRQQIINAVGAPNSISAIGEDRTLLQWQRTGYHVALVFRGNVCEGISHEFSA